MSKQEENYWYRESRVAFVRGLVLIGLAFAAIGLVLPVIDEAPMFVTMTAAFIVSSIYGIGVVDLFYSWGVRPLWPTPQAHPKKHQFKSVPTHMLESPQGKGTI